MGGEEKTSVDGLALSAKSEAAWGADGTQRPNAARRAGCVPIGVAGGCRVAEAGAGTGAAIHCVARVAAPPVACLGEDRILQP